MKKLLLLLVLMLSISPSQAAIDSSHKQWNDLLRQHVQWNVPGTASTVDYEGFLKDRAKLDGYLKSLSSVSKQDYSKWPLNEQQAFLINAYNAYTVALVLTRYPDMNSIKDLGGVFSSPWEKTFFELLGEKRSLDDVEHILLRGDKRYREPRIHFAVNCASIGCPALRNEAYTGTKLINQLDDQTIRFLSDTSRNRFYSKTGVFSVSKIFDWYSEDFERHAGGVKKFIAAYAGKIKINASEIDYIKQAKFKLDYSAYDWTLNKQK